MILPRSNDAGNLRTHTLLDDIRNHRLIFVGTVAAGAIAACAYWAVTPNRYIAEAVVALDARKVQVITMDSVVSRLPQDSPVLRTELDLIASRSMAQQVVDRLGLAAQTGTVEPGRSLTSWLFNPFGSSGPGERSAAASAVDRLVSGLRVNNDGRSYTIFISYEARDPQFARSVANAYAQAYLDHQITLQTQATRNASDWLGRKVSELGARLQTSETTVEDFRRKSGLVETNGGTSDGQRLVGINAELAAARSQRAGAEARLTAARELQRSGAGATSFSEALASAPIQALRSREAEISRGIGDIESSGATLSSQLPAQRVQLVAIRKQIDGEVERVIESLGNEVDVARRKERAIEQETAKFEADVARNSEARVELNRLDREAAANRTIYESFLNRYKQTIEQEGLASADATLLSSAEAPMSPASPKLLPFLALGLVGGAVCGAGLASLRRQYGARTDSEPGAIVGDPVDDENNVAAQIWRSHQQRQA